MIFVNNTLRLLKELRFGYNLHFIYISKTDQKEMMIHREIADSW